MLKKNLFLILFLIVVASGCAGSQAKDTAYQVSTIDALLNGVYDGDTPFSEIKKHGNFGIGTFNALDGEMVALDGKFYKVKSTGEVKLVEGSEKTPFVTVTFFDSDKSAEVLDKMSFEQLKEKIESSLPTKNIIYAIKVQGYFNSVKVRSVPKQKKPYPPLIQVAKTQPVFRLNFLEGALVGFRVPEYMTGINVPKFHFHFLDKTREKGGHVLDFELEDGTIFIDETHNFLMTFPSDQVFYDLDLTQEKGEELEKVESNKQQAANSIMQHTVVEESATHQ